MSKGEECLTDGADHINVRLTGPLSKKGGTFKWTLNRDITKTKLRIKEDKTGYTVSITFRVSRKDKRKKGRTT